MKVKMTVDGRMYNWGKISNEGLRFQSKYLAEMAEQAEMDIEYYSPEDTSQLRHAHTSTADKLSEKSKGRQQVTIGINNSQAPYWEYVYYATMYGRKIHKDVNPNAEPAWFEHAINKHSREWIDTYNENMLYSLRAGIKASTVKVHKVM